MNDYGALSKYEEAYFYDDEGVPQTIQSLGNHFKFYNGERLYQSLGYKMPEAVYLGLA